MSKKLTRRQWLQLVAIATGAATLVASTQLNKVLRALAQVADESEVFLPFVTRDNDMAPIPSATNTPPSPDPTAPPVVDTPTTSPNTDIPTPTDTSTPTPTDAGIPMPTDTPTPTNTDIPTPGSGTFVDGPGGDVNTGKDVLMSSNWPSNNGGQHANFQLEGLPGTIQHALLQFDLSSLPKSYTCTSAKLYLYHSYGPEYSGLNTGQVYCIAAANWPWIEGDGNIDPAQDGEPCWDARESNGTGGVKTPWAGSEGCSTPGIDYDANPIGEWSFPSNSPEGTEIVIDLDTNRIQEWFGLPNNNYGIILITDNDVPRAHVGSAENGNPAYRPKLVVTYSA